MSDVLSIANFISFLMVLEFPLFLFSFSFFIYLEFPFLSKIITHLRFVIFLLLRLCKDLSEEGEKKDLSEEEYFLQ